MSEKSFCARHAQTRFCDAHGVPPASGVIRTRPEDFRVTEKLGFDADGDGEHLLVEVEKTGCNTEWVARRLAKSLKVARSAVSFAGMKDRHAVTRQFFSVHYPGKKTPPPESIGEPAFVVCSVARHRRKLRRGALAENEFQIRVRELSGDLDALVSRLELVRRCGCPNFFGPQRFGRDGANLGLAWRCLVDAQRFGGRERRGLVFSTARAALFDLVLAQRVRLGSWDRFVEGDLAMLEHSRSIFPVDLSDADLGGRLASLEIHPTGPLPGREPEHADSNERWQIETDVTKEFQGLIDGLARSGVDARRRSLRLVPRDLTWELEGDELVMRFSLRPGGFATTLLRSVVDLVPAAG